jgi:hypothetical protein
MWTALSFRRFSVLFLGALAAAMGGVALFNWAVDPFWYYRDIEVEGFNMVKPQFAKVERHVKPEILVRQQPRAIIFGSSFSEIGLDPLNPSFTNDGRLKGYNFGLAGTKWPEEYCAFQFALRKTQLARAVLELWLEDLPLPDCSRVLRELDGPGAGELLLAFRTLRASLSTVSSQRTGKPSHTPEGLYYYVRESTGKDKGFRMYFSARFNSEACNFSPLSAASVAAAPAPKGNPARELELEGLRTLVRMAVERGIELRFVVYPQHAYQLESDALCGEPLDRWDALAQIVAAVEREAAGSDAIQVWNFFAYNEITAEPVGNTMRFWDDPLHFDFVVGNRMLAEMFGAADTPGQPLGVRVSSGALPELRRHYDRQREQFIAAHPGFYPGLRPLIRQ